MEIGIIGLPNVGKSTVFNTLTKSSAAVSNFPFTTIEPNIGIASLDDKRLDELGKIFQPEKLTPATVRFVDIAGLVKGASQGAGLGNKFLSHIREVDVLLQVVRVFTDDGIASTLGKFDPLNEIEIIELELILSDLEQVTKAKDRVLGKAKSGDKEAKQKLSFLTEISEQLNNNKLIREINECDMRDYELHTTKSILYLLNVNESASKDCIEQLREFISKKKKCDSIVINAQVEYELTQLSAEDKSKFRTELGLETGINDLVEKAYKMLNLITFYTVVGKEVRAWSIQKGTVAKTAAGKVHTDMEKGFIRAEIYAFSELLKYKSEKLLYEKGLIRTESKDYVISDGDIVKFKFH